MSIKGAKEIKAKLRQQKTKHIAGLQRGLMRAGLALQRESMKIVPILSGNLRASAYTRPSGHGSTFEVAVGYTAKYALYVHENLEAAHGRVFNEKHADKIKKAKGKAKQYWFRRGADQQAKFLEKPFREQRKRLAEIVEVEIRKETLK
jgi:hypothetical protein